MREDLVTLEELIERTQPFSDGTWARDEILGLVEDGDAQFWAYGDSAMLTVVRDYETGLRELYVWLACGSLDGLEEILPFVERHARQIGATRLGMEGRPGWARELRKRGWWQSDVIMRKEIPHG